MKNIKIIAIASLLISFAIAPSALAFNLPMEDMGLGARKIIIWKEGGGGINRENLLNLHGRRIKDLPLVRGSVVEIKSASDLAALEESPLVLRVDDDPIAKIALREIKEIGEINWARAGMSKITSQKIIATAVQSLPWGIDRIDAELVWPTGNRANPVKIGVIDTGISTSHPDLKANLKGGVNTINPARGFNDDNGHGSHVAGIIAALDNSQGVIGGAPAADLYAIKVLNAQGSGYYSDIIEGLQWAITNNMQVVNMSLGGGSDYQPLHDAVSAAKNAGITIVAAAGNNGGAVIFPAAYPEVIAVSATDSSNNLASWSSRGPEVDLAAPGVSIYSTYKGKGYATLSGTSMASPHVAASAALVLNSPVGVYDANGNGGWDPDEVQNKLQTTSVDLGGLGFDNLFGWGLVNAFAAVQ